MAQDESELKEFLVVMNKLKQKALLAKFFSIGLVAVSGLMVAGSLGYMIYQVGNQRAGLEDCKKSKTNLVNAVRSANISESRKNQILGLENSEQLQSNDNTILEGNSDTNIQNKNQHKNQPILSNPSPLKPTANDSPKPAPAVSPKPKEPKDEAPQPKPPANESPNVNTNNPIPRPHQYCEVIKRRIEAASKRNDENEITRLRKLYRECITVKPY